MRDKILALREQGKSVRQIAEELGVGKSTVARVLKEEDMAEDMVEEKAGGSQREEVAEVIPTVVEKFERSLKRILGKKRGSLIEGMVEVFKVRYHELVGDPDAFRAWLSGYGVDPALSNLIVDETLTVSGYIKRPKQEGERIVPFRIGPDGSMTPVSGGTSISFNIPHGESTQSNSLADLVRAQIEQTSQLVSMVSALLSNRGSDNDKAETAAQLAELRAEIRALGETEALKRELAELKNKGGSEAHEEKDRRIAQLESELKFREELSRIEQEHERRTRELENRLGQLEHQRKLEAELNELKAKMRPERAPSLDELKSENLRVLVDHFDSTAKQALEILGRMSGPATAIQASQSYLALVSQLRSMGFADSQIPEIISSLVSSFSSGSPPQAPPSGGGSKLSGRIRELREQMLK